MYLFKKAISAVKATLCQKALEGVRDIRSRFAPGVASTSTSSTSSLSSVLYIIYSAEILWEIWLIATFQNEVVTINFNFFKECFQTVE